MMPFGRGGRWDLHGLCPYPLGRRLAVPRECNGHMQPGPACFREGQIASGQVRRTQRSQMLSAEVRLGCEELLQFRDI